MQICGGKGSNAGSKKIFLFFIRCYVNMSAWEYLFFLGNIINVFSCRAFMFFKNKGKPRQVDIKLVISFL